MSQPRLSYPVQIKLYDKSTPHNTFFTEQLPAAAFEVSIGRMFCWITGYLSTYSA